MQGFNMGRYIPPSALDAGLSANQASGKGHALGARARKAHLGILTVRFEMPFAVWCSTCPEGGNGQLIGQGVRFNAEKKRVGNYYSTPIWQFRMKHAACGGWIEIRTDPKSADFVVTEGGKRRDLGADVGVGAMLKEESEREKMRADAFAALEVTIEDKRRAKDEAGRIEELKSLKERDWGDPYAASQKLRREFRAGRGVREKAAAATEALQDKMSLGIELLDETDADRARARLVDFGEDTDGATTDMTRAISKPLFAHHPIPPNNTKPKPKPTSTKSSNLPRTRALQQEVSNNTRAALDPFLLDTTAARPPATKPASILGVKRRAQPPRRSALTPPDRHISSRARRSTPNDPDPDPKAAATSVPHAKASQGAAAPQALLVAYDSD